MSRQDTSPSKLSLNPPDANVMVRFVGELNGNLKFIEKKTECPNFSKWQQSFHSGRRFQCGKSL